MRRLIKDKDKVSNKLKNNCPINSQETYLFLFQMNSMIIQNRFKLIKFFHFLKFVVEILENKRNVMNGSYAFHLFENDVPKNLKKFLKKLNLLRKMNEFIQYKTEIFLLICGLFVKKLFEQIFNIVILYLPLRGPADPTPSMASI